MEVPRVAALFQDEPGTQMWQTYVKTCHTTVPHRGEYIKRGRQRVCCFLPCAGVHIVAVQIIHQAVLVGRQRLVAAVDVHATAAGIIRAAVTVSSLRNGTFGLRHQPRVGLCERHTNRK